MLSAEKNEMLTASARDTPMGAMYRRHWIPVARSEDVPLSGGPPIRLRLLGEDLVLFRAGDGRLGLLSEWCPHRGASLYFGRNERADSPTGPGLRCVYHGWKFAVDGSCVDMPNEPEDSTFRDRVRARAAYPCVELAGVVWAYLGEPELRPDPPRLPWTVLPDDHVYASVRLQLCNSIQAFEGAVDASHVGILHSDIGLWDAGDEFKRVRGGIAVDKAPRFYVEQTDFGLTIGARRRMAGGQAYWRFTQVVLPWYVVLSKEPGAPGSGHAWVPVDEHRTYTWTFSFRDDRPLDAQEVARWRAGGGLHAPLVPGTLTPTMNRGNDYLINRDLQASASMTGISNVGMQDAAVQENMGPHMPGTVAELGSRMDRGSERLGSADAGVVATRRVLLAAAAALDKDATIRPPGVLSEDQAQARPYPSMLVPEETGWHEVRGRAEAESAGRAAPPAGE
ncbi:Rieske 2Fe-2S domain-containing protein [Phytohabitans sp. ZYX-F-186]|uniref:Rieske 2Fe-2S domain-containing protein n=1 Tax=Phytohabitans maris TaxID=3071409 RepID=A0ABU0Z971_9ACTN|nr:Rieske 2Fe-2S domain-containing protein [Phytohabitans sp. ZYX-F-186]MDQ7903595.1 Rieske 2Fe-2S domain-containing protein [Phytohabitans sp. ZYX-F-186]